MRRQKVSVTESVTAIFILPIPEIHSSTDCSVTYRYTKHNSGNLQKAKGQGEERAGKWFRHTNNTHTEERTHARLSLHSLFVIGSR